MLTFIILLLVPDSTITLNDVYHSIEAYGNNLYLAAFANNCVHKMGPLNELSTITFTDDLNYRINSFALTPFVLYLNNGRTIEKYYLASGIKEKVFRTKDISSFIVLDNEELIISDRVERELIFLDFLYKRRLTISDISIKDMYHADNILYTLTNNSVMLFDEHGNINRTLEIPFASTNILVQDSTILIFHEHNEYLYIMHDTWQIIELGISIKDAVMLDQILIILAASGSSLYFYDLSDLIE